MGARGHPRIRDSPGERDYFDPIWPRQLSHHQSLIPINLRRSQRTAEAPEKRGWRVVRGMCARHKMTSRRCIHFARSCGGREGGGGGWHEALGERVRGRSVVGSDRWIVSESRDSDNEGNVRLSYFSFSSLDRFDSEPINCNSDNIVIKRDILQLSNFLI